MRQNKDKAFLWVLFIIVIWETSARLKLLPSYVLPSFTDVILMMGRGFKSGELLLQSANSVGVILQALVISILMSVILAYLCVISSNVNSFIMTLCAIFNPLPSIAVLPLVMIWFGITGSATLVLVVHATLWPLIISLVAGFKSISQTQIESARNLNLSSFRMVWDVMLYGTMPHFLAGIKTGWSRAWRALLSIEMIFGSAKGGGLGFYIYRQRAYANVTGVFVGILVIIIIGVFVEEYVFNAIERNTIQKWGIV